MKQNKLKIYVGIGIVVCILLLVGVVVVIGGRGKTTTETQKSTLPQNEELQVVENGVKVSAKAGADGRRVNFMVSNIPSKYTTIEYEFSYLTGTGRLQGGNSSPAEIKNGEYTKEILLGTCSAGGACTYDTGVTSIKFSIIFTAGDERRTFVKEFSLAE